MSAEQCKGCNVVNILDRRINDLVLQQTTLYLKESGESGLSSFTDLLRWYLQMKRKARTSGHSEKENLPNPISKTELTFQILREQSPAAAKEISEYFEVIQRLTIKDRFLLTLLLTYKLLYSPVNQAGRMLDSQKCQRECSVGFAKWYVWARMTLNLDPDESFEFACTALMAKCEGLNQSGTQAKSISFWNSSM